MRAISTSGEGAGPVASLYTTARKGDRRQTLVSLRDRLARAIDSCESGRDMAALSRRFMEVLAELEALPDPSGADGNPALAARERVRARGGG